MHFDKVVYFVTGGASGLGLASAQQLLSLGAYVAVLDLIPEEKGEALLANTLKIAKGSQPPQAIYSRSDIASEEQVKRAIEKADATWGSNAVVGGVVHCGGVGMAGKVIDNKGEPFSLDIYRKTIEINLVGSFNVARLVASRMARTIRKPSRESPITEDNGVIILTSSVSYEEGQMGQCAYGSSKAGVAGLTLPMARDLARWGIRVVTIAPSLFETAMGKNTSPAVKASLLSTTLFPPRFGKASEFGLLAKAIIENPMLNGSVLRLDGGSRMSKF